MYFAYYSIIICGSAKYVQGVQKESLQFQCLFSIYGALDSAVPSAPSNVPEIK